MKNIILIGLTLIYLPSCSRDCNCVTTSSYQINGAWIESSRSNFVTDDCNDVPQGINYQQSTSGYNIKVTTLCD